jgi:hypothetical protein
VHAGEQCADVLSAGRCRPLTVRFVDVAQLVDAVIAGPRIVDNRRARFEVCSDEGVERRTRTVTKDRHAAPPVTLRLLAFDSYSHQDLLALGPPAAQAGLLAAEEGLIHLDGAGEPVPPGSDENRAKPVEHRPRRLVRADVEPPLQAQRRDPIRLGGEQPTRREPHGERCPPAVEERACRRRSASTAARALVAAISHCPAVGGPTLRADEALGPTDPLQVVQAVGITGEPGLELAHRPRIVHARPGPGLRHAPIVVRSDG